MMCRARASLQGAHLILYLCFCVFVFMCVSLSSCVCLCLHVCVCVCPHVCVCVSPLLLRSWTLQASGSHATLSRAPSSSGLHNLSTPASNGSSVYDAQIHR